ncbi:MAG: DUF6279 family lipoprotein [bacterium]
MAEFSEVQKAEIQSAVDEYATWHRRNELPRYAEFIAELQAKVESGHFDHQGVMQDMEVVRDFAKTGFLQSPFAQSAQFVKSLDDNQINQVAQHFDDQNKKSLAWIEKYEPEEGNKMRLKSIVKNTRRFGISLNEDQKLIIAEGLMQYDNDPMERHLLWNRWEEELIELLKNRGQSGFDSKLTSHLHQYQDQMRIHNPERDIHNRKVSAQIIYDVVHNLDPKQRQVLVAKLDETRRILLRISSG